MSVASACTLQWNQIHTFKSSSISLESAKGINCISWSKKNSTVLKTSNQKGLLIKSTRDKPKENSGNSKWREITRIY